jgi:hypothetical protein
MDESLGEKYRLHFRGIAYSSYLRHRRRLCSVRIHFRCGGAAFPGNFTGRSVLVCIPGNGRICNCQRGHIFAVETAQRVFG